MHRTMYSGVGTIGSTTTYQICREIIFFRGGVDRVLNDANHIKRGSYFLYSRIMKEEKLHAVSMDNVPGARCVRGAWIMFGRT
jgi:hypothetical protein